MAIITENLDPPTDPNVLMQAADCMKCIPGGMEGPVIIYLLQQIAGNTMTANQLMQEAACLKCIPAGLQLTVQNYLLDQILQSL